MLRKETKPEIVIRSLLLFIIVFTGIYSNAQKIIDTLDSPNGPMVIYADRSWQYLEDLNFDGVMNERLHEELVLDTTIGFIQSWNHDMCYTSDLQNDPVKLKDTIWVCVEDSISDRFQIPFDGKDLFFCDALPSPSALASSSSSTLSICRRSGHHMTQRQ